MAEEGTNHVASSLQQGDSTTHEPENEATDSTMTTSNSAQEPPASSFSAINSQSMAENANAAVNTASHGSNASVSTPPPEQTDVAHAAPQTAQTSGASNTVQISSQLDDLDDTMAVDAAIHGTRSRNRAGNARPNYAEDQEMEFEPSSTATTKKRPVNQSAATAAQDPAEAKRAQDFARFIAVNSNSTPDKESTPGVIPSLSKKRKAAGPPATLTQTPPASNSPAPAVAAAVATRKPAPSTLARETNVMTFIKNKSCLNKKGELVADDGTKLAINDHVYLVCEPPGDPYYLCRVMEFLHVRSDDPNSPIDSLRVNWYYRPRDVQRFNSDSRLVYGTMHSDLCPLTSLRGKCMIKHRSEIDDLDAYRKERDSFYFSQIFDRFIHRWYECIPVSQIVNVPERVKKALDERWKFVVVEIGRVKELTSEVKTCKRCSKYCASSDSVDCAICRNSYHMNCVQPPLPKKPSRGFAWACGPCSRAHENRLDARNTPMSGNVTEAEEEELVEEEIPSASNETTRAPSPSGYNGTIDDHPATQAEVALAKMWPMRYLGIHCRVEDAIQYDDRAIYPRASSRLGPRHQANVSMWPGRPVELVKPAEIKKRYNKSTSHKKDAKLTKETVAALEADREERAQRPKWVQDEPTGYIARGEDHPSKDAANTAKMMFRMPPQGQHSERGMDDKPSPLGREHEIEEYLKRAKTLARSVGVPPFGANFLDKALEFLTDNDYNQDAALKQLQKVDRVKDLHEPVLSKDELIKFEEGVAKYGSEHRLVHRHMKTAKPISTVIRFYYLWKKTPKGREIWGNYGGRKGSKRRVDDLGAQVQQSVANEGDDSAFDNEKAARRNRVFQCKFCNGQHSRQWRRAPGVAPGQAASGDSKNVKEKAKAPLLALCLRCANLWRKYAIQWEDVDEVAKKVAQGGGRAWKRRIDEELLRELIAANEATSMPGIDPAAAAVPSIEASGEPAKKKAKIEKPPPPPKEPTPPPPPIIPNQPQWKVLPCSVCKTVGNTIACDHCKLTIHRQCFGLSENEGIRADGEVRWVCEQCSNDRNPQVSTDYACCLCLTEETFVDLVVPPKVSHKKRTDREKEKERMEKELADAMRADHRNKQLAMHRSLFPREPLKRTTGNNWVHVYCAVWTPEIRFSNAKAFEIAEGFQQIPAAKHEAVCKLCKNRDHQNRFRDDKGACVSCFQCHANIHVSCAFEAGYTFGFDVTPVKGSRKDQVTTATLAGETGSLIAAIWCKEHIIKTNVHPMHEIVDDTGKTALQVFAENYKQADLTMTGTVRKANLAQLTKDKGQQAQQPLTNGTRKDSTSNSIAAAVRRGARTSSTTEAKSEGEDGSTQISEVVESLPQRRCAKCKIDVTPKWHPLERPAPKVQTPPKSPRRLSMTLGEIADRERERIHTADARPSSEQSRPPNVQNIRFMPPGASGRAWDGMPDRYASRSAANGDQNAHPPPSRESGAHEVNGDSRPPLNESSRMDVDRPYHTSGLPRSALTPPPAAGDVETDEFLCHKCFLKKKLDPTPPPPERPQVPFSPPRQFPLNVGWNGLTQPPFDPGQPARMPWDPPPPQAQPPPPSPQINGLGVSMGYEQHPQHPQHAPHAPHPSHPPPPSTQGYPPFGHQQPNGYHHLPPQHSGPPPPQHSGPPPQHQGPPPQHQGPPPPHPGPPPMHDRQNSYGYGGPPAGPPNVPHHYQHPPPPPPPRSSYPPPNPPLPNGITSPRPPQPPPRQSPGHPHAPPYSGYGPPARYEQSPFLPPINQPRFGSPHTPRQPPPPQSQPQQQQPHSDGTNGQRPPPPLPASSQPQQQPLPPPPSSQPQPASLYTSPQTSQARPSSQAGRPATPHESQESGTAGQETVGASASPNLRNLLS